jgi:hypothetical protein
MGSDTGSGRAAVEAGDQVGESVGDAVQVAPVGQDPQVLTGGVDRGDRGAVERIAVAAGRVEAAQSVCGAEN